MLTQLLGGSTERRFIQHKGAAITPAAIEQAEVGLDQVYGYTPVFAGISRIAGDMATMPWVTKRKRKTSVEVDGETIQQELIEDATRHPTYKLLLRKIGEGEFTTNLLVESLISQAIFYGIAGCRIHRGGPQFLPTRLEWIPHRIHTLDRGQSGDGRRYYQYTDEQNVWHDRVDPDDMFIVLGPSSSPFTARGLVHLALSKIKSGLNAEGWQDSYFSGKGVPLGFFQYPGELPQQAYDRLVDAIQRRMMLGQKWIPLEEGATWAPSGINPKDAMVVQALTFSGEDVCRYLKIPPQLLGYTTGSGTETPAKSVEANQRYYYHSVLKYWSKKLECEGDDKLFREDQKTAYFTKFDPMGFLTASISEQTQADQVDIMSGVRTIDEVRRQRNMNPHPSGAGVKPLLPLNMTTDPERLGEAEPPPATGGPPGPPDGPPTDEPADDRSDQVKAVIVDAIQRVLRRSSAYLRDEAKRGRNFVESVDKLDRAERLKAIEEVLRPAITLAGGDVAEVSRDLMRTTKLEFLSAAEVPADKLVASVQHSAESLIAKAPEMADGWTNGKKKHR